MIDITDIPQGSNHNEIEYWINVSPIGNNHSLKDLIKSYPDATIEYTVLSDAEHYLTVTIYTKNAQIFRYEVEESLVNEKSISSQL